MKNIVLSGFGQKQKNYADFKIEEGETLEEAALRLYNLVEEKVGLLLREVDCQELELHLAEETKHPTFVYYGSPWTIF